jgi:hypothetical protein
MRFTQFGHQVPRKNSTTAGPRSSNFASETSPAPFAEASVNSGARSPTFRVELCCVTGATVDHWQNRDNNRNNTGISGGNPLVICDW